MNGQNLLIDNYILLDYYLKYKRLQLHLIYKLQEDISEELYYMWGGH